MLADSKKFGENLQENKDISINLIGFAPHNNVYIYRQQYTSITLAEAETI